MRTLILTFLVLAASSSGASAYCLEQPDTGATHYVQNQTSETICQQSQAATGSENAVNQLRLRPQVHAQTKYLGAPQRMQTPPPLAPLPLNFP
jgi:hypothetical protein